VGAGEALIARIGQTATDKANEEKQDARLDGIHPSASVAGQGCSDCRPTVANVKGNNQTSICATCSSFNSTSFTEIPPPAFSAPPVAPDLQFATAPSGLQWADAKKGSGQPLTSGSPVAIDYVMSTTGARYGSKIYSSKDSNAPYRWKLGDGSTIAGLEQAIIGDDSVAPMLPGGVRRVIIPAKLGYQQLAQPIPGMQFQDCQEGKGVGPIPPASEGNAGEYYQRFKNIYCNANRPYQPDLVMDIKLYGKRTP
jgi:hypothetical protein